MTPLDLLIDGLAVFRLSRLVTTDGFPPILRIRRWVLEHWPSSETVFLDSEVVQGASGPQTRRGLPVVKGPDGWLAAPHWLGELVECVWCASMYIAAGVVVLRVWWDWWEWPALILAFSAAAGLLHRE